MTPLEESAFNIYCELAIKTIGVNPKELVFPSNEMQFGQGNSASLPVHDSDFPLDCLALFLKVFKIAKLSEIHYKIETTVTDATTDSTNNVGILEYDKVAAPYVEDVVRRSDFLRAIAYGVENVLRKMDPLDLDFNKESLRNNIRIESAKLLRRRRSMWHIIAEGLNRLLTSSKKDRVTLKDTHYDSDHRIWSMHGHQLRELVRTNSWAAFPQKVRCIILSHYHLQFITLRYDKWVVFNGHWSIPYLPRIYWGIIPHIGLVMTFSNKGKSFSFNSSRFSDRIHQG